MIVGMDFGTTNSGMSVYDGQHLRLIPLDRANANSRVVRTSLYITNRRRIYIGREAIDKYYEQNLDRKVKYQRIWVGEIALQFAELPEFVRDVSVETDVLSPGRLFLSFKTGLKSATYLGTMVGTQFYYLEDIVGLYLYTAKLRAEEYLQTSLKRIVLGRPVRFSTDPEQDKLAERRLVHAAFLAGYEEVYLQYEPIAAAYFYETGIDHPQNVLIFDFGGGTLDITIARLGGRGQRDILATGGVPIAGDIFDQKLVRATLPRHFGEGTSFHFDKRQSLPIPAYLFEAFTDWQAMLELNKPDIMHTLEQMARTANQRLRILRLISLIKSNYSLKMFDAAEAAKRVLSEQILSMLALDGPSFSVREPVTRNEFELLISEEIRVIADLLDEVVRQAGLRDTQIDAVIRTGGSAQIPAFIRLLEERFGPEKVQSIDTFSSVTSGLGIIGHYLDTGEIDLHSYRRAEWTYNVSVRQHGRPGAPTVDLNLMKKFIDLEEHAGQQNTAHVCIVAVSENGQVAATTQPQSRFDSASIPLSDLGLQVTSGDRIIAGPPEKQVLLITSDYRFFLRTLQHLTDLADVHMSLAAMESFYADRFGHEAVTALVDWHTLPSAQRLMLISNKGEAKIVRAETLLPHLAQTYPYQMERIAGEPVALVSADEGELVLITNQGSVLRLKPGKRPNGTQRIMRLRKDEWIVRVLTMSAPGEILMTTTTGHGKRLHTRALEISNSADLGVKTLTGYELSAGMVVNPDAPFWAVTTHRVCPLTSDTIPLDSPTPPHKRTLLRLQPDEELVATLPSFSEL